MKESIPFCSFQTTEFGVIVFASAAHNEVQVDGFAEQDLWVVGDDLVLGMMVVLPSWDMDKNTFI